MIPGDGGDGSSRTMLFASDAYGGVELAVLPRRPWPFSCVPAMLAHLSTLGEQPGSRADVARRDYDAIRAEISDH